MSKKPGIFIRYEVIRDAKHPTIGNREGFKTNVSALIDAGNVLAVGEDRIECVFESAEAFREWFDGML